MAPSPAFATALPKLIAVMNHWDDRDYAAMLSPGRPAYPREKDELAGYHERHGDCRGFTPIEVMQPTAARFRIECDKQPLEMTVSLGATGLIDGFTGTTNDAVLTKEERAAATALAKLIGKWDESAYTKVLASKSRARDETASFFERVRALHGACAVKTGKQRGFDRSVVLACDRGGDVTLTFNLDDADRSRVRSFGIRNVQSGTCPVQ